MEKKLKALYKIIQKNENETYQEMKQQQFKQKLKSKNINSIWKQLKIKQFVEEFLHENW